MSREHGIVIIKSHDGRELKATANKLPETLTSADEEVSLTPDEQPNIYEAGKAALARLGMKDHNGLTADASNFLILVMILEELRKLNEN